MDETRRKQQTEDERLSDRFAEPLSERRKRAQVRREIQAEDLDLPPAEVEQLVTRRLAARKRSRKQGGK
jgi:hypothetical protein